MLTFTNDAFSGLQIAIRMLILACQSNSLPSSDVMSGSTCHCFSAPTSRVGEGPRRQQDGQRRRICCSGSGGDVYERREDGLYDFIRQEAAVLEDGSVCQGLVLELGPAWRSAAS